MKAAAGGAFNMIGDYYAYTTGTFETLALTLPTVSRSADLNAALISELKLKHYTRQWTGEKYEEIYLPAISSGKFREVSATGSLRVLVRVR